jgi:hypothetical protein
MKARAAALLILLLGWQAAGQAPPAPSGGITLIAARLSGLERLPPEVAAAARNPEPWIQDLLARWQESYGSRVRLTDARASGKGTASATGAGQNAAELEVEATQSGFRALTRLRTPGGKILETRSSLVGHRGSALLSVLAGDLFFLWAQAAGFDLPPAQPPPPLSRLLSLDSLSLLPGWPAGRVDALDCAATADGPILLFADRLLSLDAELNVGPATALDLCLRPPWPKGFLAGRLFLTPLGQPVVYGPATGEVLIYPPAGAAERLASGVQEPTHAASLPRGGLAFLKNGLLFRTLRRGVLLVKEQLPLPVGFYAAIEGDARGGYWLLDLAERRLRVFDPAGGEIRSVKPAMDPARLPFPQVFLPMPDGGLLLGGAGELWRFDAFGVPVWRLTSVFTGVREGLPPFFRVAYSNGFVYLLDPQGRRLYRFGEAAEEGAAEPQAAGGTSGEAPRAGGGTGDATGGGAGGDGAAELLARFEAGQAGAGELVQGFLDRGLILAALPFFRAIFPEASAGETQRLARRVKAQIARALSKLAEGYERELRLADAEAAAAEGIRLARELRAEDPVEPAYAQMLRQLTEQRNRLREELLPGAEGGLEGRLEAASETGHIFLALRNPGLEPLGPIGVQARWSGLSGSESLELMEPIRPGYTVRLPLAAPASPALQPTDEDLSVSLSVLLRYERGGQELDRYLRAAFLRSPDGRLRARAFANTP